MGVQAKVLYHVLRYQLHNDYVKATIFVKKIPT